MSDLSSYRTIRVMPVTGYLGADVEGIDVSKPIPDGQMAELKRAWHAHSVLFLRNQKLTPETIEALGGCFGPLTVTSYANTVKGFKYAHSLVRAAEVPKGERNFGDSWHIDQSVRPIPNAGFALYAVDVPPYGGDTGFLSLYAAYEALSPGMRALCDSLVAVHSPSGLFGRDGTGGPGKKPFMLAGAEKVYTMTHDKMLEYMRQETEHPLVCEHPETGRRHLYITGYCTRFRGMTEEESQPLLQYLTTHVSRPEFTCRLRWQNGTLAIIDNRCLQHIAYQDYAGFRREMLRVEWADTKPPYGPALPLP